MRTHIILFGLLLTFAISMQPAIAFLQTRQEIAGVEHARIKITELPDACWLISVNYAVADYRSYIIRAYAEDRGDGYGPQYSTTIDIIDFQTGETKYSTSKYERVSSIWSTIDSKGTASWILINYDLFRFSLVTLNSSGALKEIVNVCAPPHNGGLEDYNPVFLYDWNADGVLDLFIRASHALNIAYLPNSDKEISMKLPDEWFGQLRDDIIVVVNLKEDAANRFHFVEMLDVKNPNLHLKPFA